jgi:hypothetical protein
MTSQSDLRGSPLASSTERHAMLRAESTSISLSRWMKS